MKLGLVIISNDPETVWNAFRFGVFALQQGDMVKVFLLGKGVEAETLHHAQFNVIAQIQQFVEKGGTVLACGTCLKIRAQGATEVCPLSTMKDLYELVGSSDKVLTF
jgi:sulfur relay (sulfurtransferase) complex TusBCD TusD component (DsrE family)